MIAADPLTLPDALPDAKAYLRIDQDAEDGLIVALVASAAQACEAFTGQILITRTVRETIRASGEWRRLGTTPVREIMAVEGMDAAGNAYALPGDGHASEIDADGYGWVRLVAPIAEAHVRVTYMAGLAAEWADTPDTLRQGVMRLTAHLFTHRDGVEDAGPPAAVAALWRPWRRMRLR